MDEVNLTPTNIALGQIFHELRLLRYLREAELQKTPQFEFYKKRCADDNELRSHLDKDKALD